MNAIEEKIDEQYKEMMDQINQLRMDPYFTFNLEDDLYHSHANYDAEKARRKYAKDMELWEAIEHDWDLTKWNDIIDQIFI